jgi:hypothetical protein
MANGDDDGGSWDDAGTSNTDLARQAMGYRMWNAMGTPADHATHQAYQALTNPYQQRAIPVPPAGQMQMMEQPDARATPVRPSVLAAPQGIQMPPMTPPYQAQPIPNAPQMPQQAPPITVNAQLRPPPMVGGAPAPAAPPAPGMGPASQPMQGPTTLSQLTAAEQQALQRNRMAASMGNPALLGAPSDVSGENPFLGAAGMAGGGF